ncbi:MAG: competence/damage-inducible protein A [Roseitalea sp.]|nr:competence/damage-inducible protein A [Roseitalea sp.]MBO6950958.1 competence/damage-inducible protein A [Rhizobiaceae bacterium]MBO6591055.1 competence/damage-inducible protein A [Roseitalea sp.]MBO6599687.1 competence/damage-inducible protein A [Roseitalea sp.]MBO6611443.1 competence/damage-inducible protein A [Roseitalea sp.]
MSDTIVTAAMIVIGDEILSGRTREANAHHLARVLTGVGIDLREIRVVGDDKAAIIEAVNVLRARYTYVFTSGGIGPTHDDITADAVGAAFGLPVEPDPAALAMLTDHYAKRGQEFTAARRRMARVPEGAVLIDNPVTTAPGFLIGNVHVLAGVPAIFQAMLDNVLPSLRTGRKLLSDSIECPFGEGVIGAPLGAIQAEHPDAIIGSYPRYEDGRHWAEIVVRAADPSVLDTALADVRGMLDALARGE